MNSEERSQVSEALRRRLQAWKVWQRGIRVLPQRSKQNGSTVPQEQAPRIQGLALQHVAQRIASLALQDQLWRQVESNNFILHLEQRIQFCNSESSDILWRTWEPQPGLFWDHEWTIERRWDDLLDTWEPQPGLFWDHEWLPSPLLGHDHINCSGISHLLNFQFIAYDRYNYAMKARKKRVPCEPVRDQCGQCWNAVTGELLIPGHLARMLEEASPSSSISLNGGAGDAHTLEMSNGVLLHPLQCSSDQDSREGGGSEASVVDEGGCRFVIIDIEGMDDVHAPQQKSDQASVAAAHTNNLTGTKLELPIGGGGDASAVGKLVTKVAVDVQNFVSTIFGGLVVLSFTNLTGTSKGDYPEFIRFGLYVGYVLLIVLTFLGLTTKKMAELAMRVAAGMSIAAVTISTVYEVSDKVYIKGIIGILGAMGTLATTMI